MGMYETLEGGTRGFAAASPLLKTNPWAVAGVTGLSAISGLFAKEPRLSPMERRYNQLSMQGMAINNASSALALKQARRMDIEQDKIEHKQNRIGKMLAGYFKQLSDV